MMGLSCDWCKRFAPMMFSPAMFGGYTQQTPPGWITMNEEQARTGSTSGLFSYSAPEQPQPPPTFCKRECMRDYLRAQTLIDGPAAS